MACKQITGTGIAVPDNVQSFLNEVDCLSLGCKEGACCEGTTCTVKPECQCQGTGKAFKGVGTTCTPNPCLCCCEFFDLHAGGVSVTKNADSYCVASNNRAIGPCDSSAVVVSVSGVASPSVPDEPGWLDSGTELLKDLSFANTSQTAREICGQSGVTIQGPSENNSGFFVASSTLDVYSWFSPYDSLHDISSDRCSSGSVRFRVELTLRRIYRVGSYSVGYPLVYKGFHKGDCTSLDSLPTSSSMLAGKTVTMTCEGSFSYNGSPGWSYPAAPQTITVSFSANPLP